MENTPEIPLHFRVLLFLEIETELEDEYSQEQCVQNCCRNCDI